jgi:hypothetical protein
MVASPEEIAARVWAAQDAEDRVGFVRAKVESGEWKLLDRIEPPSAQRVAIVDKLVAWRHALRSKVTGRRCMCSAYVCVRTARIAERQEIVR